MVKKIFLITLICRFALGGVQMVQPSSLVDKITETQRDPNVNND